MTYWGHFLIVYTTLRAKTWVSQRSNCPLRDRPWLYECALWAAKAVDRLYLSSNGSEATSNGLWALNWCYYGRVLTELHSYVSELEVYSALKLLLLLLLLCVCMCVHHSHAQEIWLPTSHQIPKQPCGHIWQTHKQRINVRHEKTLQREEQSIKTHKNTTTHLDKPLMDTH